MIVKIDKLTINITWKEVVIFVSVVIGGALVVGSLLNTEEVVGWIEWMKKVAS